MNFSKKVLGVASIIYFIFRTRTENIALEQKIYFNPRISDIFERNKLFAAVLFFTLASNSFLLLILSSVKVARHILKCI